MLIFLNFQLTLSSRFSVIFNSSHPRTKDFHSAFFGPNDDYKILRAKWELRKVELMIITSQDKNQNRNLFLDKKKKTKFSRHHLHRHYLCRSQTHYLQKRDSFFFFFCFFVTTGPLIRSWNENRHQIENFPTKNTFFSRPCNVYLTPTECVTRSLHNFIKIFFLGTAQICK